MISEKVYYQFVYNRLIDKNSELFIDCDEKNLEFFKVPDELNELYVLLNEVERKYGFNMQKMITPNYNKFVLWQECFIGSVDILKLKFAMQFVIFCCLADKILDSLRFSNIQKEQVCKKLNIKHFISDSEYLSDEFPEMDVLLNNIRRYFISDKLHCVQEKKKILDCMDKAFISEIYMYKHPLEQVEKFDPKEMPLLVDKSIQFETAAFLMATFGRNTNISLDAAIETANIFWLVDDLCDFIEDIKAKRKNSMLFFCVHNNELLTIAERAKIAFHNAEEFICLLEENLTLLKTNTSQQFYQYILNEVWEWCSNVRKLSK